MNKVIKKLLLPIYHSVFALRLGFAPAVQVLRAAYVPGLHSLKTTFSSQPLLMRGRTSDPIILSEIFALRVYETPATRIETIMDLGANVGYASIWYSHFYPYARILAVEPETENFGMLVKNCQVLENITCHQAAIWDKKATLVLQDASLPNSNFQFDVQESGKDASAVQATTIPDLMEMHKIKKIDLLKMDIENAEQAVFAGDVRWLKHVRYMQVEVHSAQANENLFQALKDARYRQVIKRRRVPYIDYWFEFLQ